MGKGGLTNRLHVKFLKEFGIFSSLSDEALKEVVKLVRFLNIKKGRTLFDQGDEGRELFIVLSGEIGISIHLTGGGEKEITTFSVGQFFGEMSIFENAPRSAKAYSKTETNLLSLNDLALHALMEKHPYIAVLIMQKMLNITTGRLQKTNQFVGSIVRWGEDARKRAITDEFTGAFNRRYFDEIIQESFQTAQANNLPLSVVMVDLDFFRSINDAYGEDVGDQAIKRAAEVFQQFLRKTDILVRYGGDEFTFIFPATNSADAYHLCEVVRQEIARLDIFQGLKGKVKQLTTSQGIASYPEHASSLKELLEKADQALYSAKEGGRNQVARFSLE